MSARDHEALERVTPDHLPVCPDCHDISFPGSTVCDSCGTHLLVRQDSGRPFTLAGPHGCTCGGEGICTRCVIASLDEGKAL